MKALTICQPYAHLILLPTTDPRHKRVENRTRWFHYRGELLIHAGKSLTWLDFDDHGIETECGLTMDEMVFGAIVGVATLIGCSTASAIMHPDPDDLVFAHGADVIDCRAWLPDHQHVAGPMCLILHHVRKFIDPIPYRGSLGLFNVPDAVVAEQMAKAVMV